MNDKERFIADLYPAAKKVSQATGMSWELILAQAAQETGWGQRQLPSTNNIFNIKSAGGWDGPSKTFNVWEIENGKKVWKEQNFRVYSSYDEALLDRVKFLKENPRYVQAGLFNDGILGSIEKEAAALQKAGYATDPHYAQSLVSVFNGRTMQNALKLAQAQQASEMPDGTLSKVASFRIGERTQQMPVLSGETSPVIINGLPDYLRVNEPASRHHPNPEREPGKTAPTIPAPQPLHLRLRDPSHPNHSVYSELKERLPDACENRLVQLTAACHISGFRRAEQLGRIDVTDSAVFIEASSISQAGTHTRIDITSPSPTPQESMRLVQDHDQQQATQLAQIQAQQQIGDQGAGLRLA